jgi:selenide,water dikinase
MELAAAGLLTSGDKSNRAYVGEDVKLSEVVGPALASLLFDPQTAGGLLISVASDRAATLLETLRPDYPDAALVGRVTERGPHLIRVE